MKKKHQIDARRIIIRSIVNTLERAKIPKFAHRPAVYKTKEDCAPAVLLLHLTQIITNKKDYRGLQEMNIADSMLWHNGFRSPIVC
jgi:hypothetical protein